MKKENVFELTANEGVYKVDIKHIPYRMVLDFDVPCGTCGREMTIWIKSDLDWMPSFRFCGCQSPTFVLSQDEVGEIPSFARSNH